MRRFFSAILAVFLCCFFTGCEVQNESPFAKSDYPATAGEIIIKEKPRKVVCLSPSYSEIICELGLESQLCAVGEECVYPPSLKQLPAVKTGLDFSADEIIKLAPDLVISQASLPSKDLARLSENSIQILTIKQPEKISELAEVYALTATALAGGIDGPAMGTAKYGELETALEKIVSALPKSKPSFLYSIDLENTFATPDTFESDVLSIFGKNYITKGSKYEVNFGDTKIRPQIVFINSPYELENARDAKMLKGVPAVKKGKVYILKPEYFSAKSLRLADNIKKIAKTLYPKIKF